MVKINIFLKEGSSIEEFKETASLIDGVQKIIQVFPNDNDEELSRSFVLEVESEDIVDNLKNLFCIETIELTPKRTLANG